MPKGKKKAEKMQKCKGFEENSLSGMKNDTFVGPNLSGCGA